MSTCISREGEYSDHVLADDGPAAERFVCKRCFALAEDELLAALDVAERKADINYRLADDRSAWKPGYDEAHRRAEEWERNSRNWQREAEEAHDRERADWSGWLDGWLGAVGPKPPTVEDVARALREGPRPFGCSATVTTDADS